MTIKHTSCLSARFDKITDYKDITPEFVEALGYRRHFIWATGPKKHTKNYFASPKRHLAILQFSFCWLVFTSTKHSTKIQ